MINIFARQKGPLQETLSQLKTQKLSELRELKTSSTITLPSSHTPSDHTHPAKLSDMSSVEDKSSTQRYSLSFPSPSPPDEGSSSNASAPHDWVSPVHSVHASPSSVLTATSTQMSQSHTLQSPAHSSQHHTITTSQSAVHPEGDIPAITPPGSPSFVDTFSANVSSSKTKPSQHATTASSVKSSSTPAGETSTPGGPTGGRLSPRSLSLKLQAELTLLETIEESMRQLATVEGSQAVSNAQQETTALAQLLESQRQTHKKELSSVAARAQAMEEERVRQHAMVGGEGAAALAELQRVKEEAERRRKQEAERIAHMEREMTRQAQEATRQLAEARTAASDAVISSARLQVEASHNMAVSVATAAAREAVTAAMAGGYQPPSSPKPPEPTAAGGGSKAADTYTSDFEDSFQPDSLAEESSKTASSAHTEVEGVTTAAASQLVPTGTSSADSTLTPVLSAVESEGEGGGGEEGERGLVSSESHISVPEEVDGGGEEVCKQYLLRYCNMTIFLCSVLSAIFP